MSHSLTTEQLHKDRAMVLGFWVYLMTDLVLFASLFATYMVLRGNTFGGPGASELFDLGFAFKETLILLASSFCAGIALVAASYERVRETLAWLGATALLGVAFLWFEVSEFVALVSEGHGPQASGFLSGYFALVGTHGLHVTLGLVWMGVLAYALIREGIVRHTARKLALLTIFWHFLDIVWIFIFALVYLFAGL